LNVPPPYTTAAPAVSIVTPAYNAARFVAETIASAQAQTMPDWEMIVVDDRSTDDTAAIVERIAAADPRVRLVRQPANAGPAEARNAALDHARARFVAFLDSDDLWLPEKLERQLAFMAETGCALSYTAYRRIDRDGGRTGALIRVPARLRYADLLKNTAIATLTAMVDRGQTGELRMIEAGYDDFVLWLSILRRGFVAHGLREDLARYRVVGGGSVSGRPLRSAGWVWRIYRDHERLGLLRSAWCLGHYGARAVLKRRTL